MRVPSHLQNLCPPPPTPPPLFFSPTHTNANAHTRAAELKFLAAQADSEKGELQAECNQLQSLALALKEHLKQPPAKIKGDRMLQLRWDRL